MAHSRVVNLDADLVSLGRRDLDVLEGEGLAGLPGDGGLAGDGLRSARGALASLAGCWSHFATPTCCRRWVLSSSRVPIFREVRGMASSMG